MNNPETIRETREVLVPMPSSRLSDVPNPFAQAAADQTRQQASRQRERREFRSRGRSGLARFLFGPSIAQNSAATKRSQARGAFGKAVQCFLLVSILLGGLLAAKHYGNDWLLSALTSDFDSLSPAQQRTRLIQIDEMGEIAIPTLVGALTADNIETARTAFELLKSGQSNWLVLGDQVAQRRQTILVDSLGKIATELADDRTGWATLLVQQAVLESVDQSDSSSQDLFDQANNTLRLLSLSQRSGPSILNSQPFDTDDTPRRLIVRSIPLPVDQLDAVDQWSQWPSEDSPSPTPLRPVARSEVVLAPVEPLGMREASVVPSTTVISTGQSSAIKLSPIESQQKVVLKPVSTAPSTPGIADPSAETYRVARTSQASMVALDDRSVMHWLLSSDDALRLQARRELQSRGYQQGELEFARQMVDPDVAVRLAFIARISRHPAIDPRPWLGMMAADEHQAVRLEIVSVLATMTDPEAHHQLQAMLTRENDSQVASRIRRVLAR